MLFGSPLGATPIHVPGMNCIGPTARSHTGSPSSRPRSVSGIAALPPVPSNTGPRIAGITAAVVGLHLADTREHRPAEQTSRVGHGQLRHGALVGAQDDGRYAGAR